MDTPLNDNVDSRATPPRVQSAFIQPDALMMPASDRSRLRANDLTRAQAEALFAQLAEGVATPRCPRCPGLCAVIETPPRPDTPYVRHRTLVRCAQCGATCSLEIPRRRSSLTDAEGKGATARPRGSRTPAPGRSVVAVALALAAAALSPAPGGALQEGEQHRNPVVPNLVASVRAAGLGGALPVAGNGGFAIFHHPALIAGEGFGLALGRAGWRNGDDDGHDHARHCDHNRHHGHCHGDPHDADALDLALSASGDWLGGGVAAGLALARSGDESLVAIGYARPLFGLLAGATARLVTLQSPESGAAAHAASFDVGIAHEFDRFTAMLTVQNLGPDLHHDNDAHVQIAERATLAAATDHIPLGPLDLGGALQVAVERGGRMVPGGGLEISYWPIQRRVFVGRIGGIRTRGNGSPMTLGAGFEGDRIRIDYAFNDADPALGAHRIGVAIR